MFFRKEKPSYCLTKVYFLADLGKSIDFEWLKKNVFIHCNGMPVEYSVNYGKDRKISTLNKMARTLTYGEIEAFDCSDDVGKVVFSLGRAGNAFDGDGELGVFECFIISNGSKSFQSEIDVLNGLSQVFSLQFGYVRSLPVDFSPGSEVRIKTGIFGSSVKVGRVQDSWLFDPKEISSGSIKGVYPVNFWRSSVLTKLEGIGFNIPLSTLCDGVVQFSQDDLKKMAKNNPSYEKFIHLN